MAYRVAENDFEPPALIKRWWARPLCWTIGHKWFVLGTNMSKNLMLAHLSKHAGIDQFCTRCGTEWYDAGDTKDFPIRITRNKEPRPPEVKPPKVPATPKFRKLTELTDLPDLPDGIFDSPQMQTIFGDRN